MLEGGSSPLSPGSECGPAAAAAEEETKDNEGQVTLKLFSSRTRQSSLQKSVILLQLYYKIKDTRHTNSYDLNGNLRIISLRLFI